VLLRKLWDLGFCVLTKTAQSTVANWKLQEKGTGACRKKSSLPPQDFSDEDLREIRLQTLTRARERNFRRENNAACKSLFAPAVWPN